MDPGERFQYTMLFALTIGAVSVNMSPSTFLIKSKAFQSVVRTASRSFSCQQHNSLYIFCFDIDNRACPHILSHYHGPSSCPRILIYGSRVRESRRHSIGWHIEHMVELRLYGIVQERYFLQVKVDQSISLSFDYNLLHSCGQFVEHLVSSSGL